MSYKITITNQTDNSVIFDELAMNEPTINVDAGTSVYETENTVISFNGKEKADNASSEDTNKTETAQGDTEATN